MKNKQLSQIVLSNAWIRFIELGPLLLIGLFSTGWAKADTINLLSPDERLKVEIRYAETIQWSLYLGDNLLMHPSMISMELGDGSVLGQNPKLINLQMTSVDETVEPLYGNAKLLRNNYNQCQLVFANNWSLVFRAYNEGVAYRFETQLEGDIIVRNETASFRFSDDYSGWFCRPDEGKEVSDWQGQFANLNISDLKESSRAYLPSLVEIGEPLKLAILEADLVDYPGMYLEAGSETGELKGWWVGYPTGFEWGSWKNACLMPTIRSDYIAKSSGKRSFPWRVVLVSEKDVDLGYSDLVYKLSTPSKLEKSDWIRPGKAAWDWYNMFGITGVDFKNGPNTPTWKAYIDFAAELGLEYAILDEGWSDVFEITKVMPNVDLQELSDYATSRNVGLVLWCAGHILIKDLDGALDFMNQFEAVKGVKVDFFQRNDQLANNMYVAIAKAAAEREFIVNFHGCYIPTGLRRTYPNILTWESIRGLEQNKWREQTTPRHDVMAAYIRLLAGPMDYTPGAMRNAAKEHHRPIFAEPMSQGTRCHQLAMFVVYDSPLQMLADTPDSYRQAGNETLQFLADVPVTWDETFILDGEIPHFIIKGRKSGESYYIGGLCDWDGRDVEISFDFLEVGNYIAQFFTDGVNADTFASDFAYWEMPVTKASKTVVRMASGGGLVARITPALK